LNRDAGATCVNGVADAGVNIAAGIDGDWTDRDWTVGDWSRAIGAWNGLSASGGAGEAAGAAET